MPTVKMTEEQIQRFCFEYQGFELLPTNEYMSHFFKTKNASVSIYKSGKVVFQGKNLEIFDDWIHLNDEDHPYDFMNSIGSDEVGTGDTFGPIVVATCYVKKQEVSLCKDLGVRDSKKIKDDEIRRIAKKLIERFKYKVLIVRNEKFNDSQKEYNLNAMKALLHDQNIKDLLKETRPDYVVLDQFCSPKMYYSYFTKFQPYEGISFEEKGESKSIAVAAASIIARYYFLLEMDRLEDLYGYKLPKGSSNTEVLSMIEKIKSDGKEDILYHIAKLSFKTFK